MHVTVDLYFDTRASGGSQLRYICTCCGIFSREFQHSAVRRQPAAVRRNPQNWDPASSIIADKVRKGVSEIATTQPSKATSFL